MRSTELFKIAKEVVLGKKTMLEALNECVGYEQELTQAVRNLGGMVEGLYGIAKLKLLMASAIRYLLVDPIMTLLNQLVKSAKELRILEIEMDGDDRTPAQKAHDLETFQTQVFKFVNDLNDVVREKFGVEVPDLGHAFRDIKTGDDVYFAFLNNLTNQIAAKIGWAI